MSVWFVTGASRGFGAGIVAEALARGNQVVAAARRPGEIERTERLLPLALDVTDEDQAHAAVEAAVREFGRIDVVVNNAGRGLLGAVEEASDSAARAIFDTNVFGVLNVQRAVLPVLREQRSGRLIQLSSVGGFIGTPGWGVYAATKFAVEGLSEALHGELKPLGIDVTIVEPGLFRTDFLDESSLHQAGQLADYAETVGAMRGSLAEWNHAQPGDPIKAARAIVDLAELSDPPLRIQLGADAVARVEAKLDLVRTELDRWRKVSLSTDHDELSTDHDNV
ncbi:SDR family NAD(P)-dependent oxidoreductase [Kribbella qitaiheensis]|uniref:SDR family NAD(P)-dependent oxidoreductase n=1 Tax=Kribbella qitaiheensis TaxID=1544730 RepID=A0A7G6X6T3_9ACTN|nr:oxidoreductase [Kribbella qitaiheensis]QNE21948.1 SDR family NAD(P)-dependent oxidoreductase [Kribbella qitaiheensis]